MHRCQQAGVPHAQAHNDVQPTAAEIREDPAGAGRWDWSEVNGEKVEERRMKGTGRVAERGGKKEQWQD